MSTLSGVSSKGEKGKSKFQSLDINSIYHKTNKGESSEQQQTKSTVPRKDGMRNLGKVPSTRRAPVNLPSLKSEHSGSDPTVSLVPTGGTGWGSKQSDVPPITSTSPVTTSGPTQVTNAPAVVGTAPVQQTNITPTPPQQPPKPTPVVTVGGDKTWSSVMVGSGESGGPPNTVGGSGPSFLAHQSPQFQAEFPSLPGEGGVPGPPPASRPGEGGYGPGPSLRPQTEGSWAQGGGFQAPSNQTSSTQARPFQPPTPPVTPSSIAPQYKGVIPSFMLNRGGSGFPGIFPGNFQNSIRPKFHNTPDNRYSSGSRPPPLSDTDDLIPRPIIKEEDLNRMDEISRDSGWATQDDIDYNQKLAFSDDEGNGNDDDKDIKCKSTLNQNKEEKKDIDTEKENRDTSVGSDKLLDKSNQVWQGRGPTIPQPEFRSPLTRLPHSNASREMDLDDVWKEKRRQTSEQVAAVAEKAKQRKEEEEKRFEETRSKSENEKKKKDEIELESDDKKDQVETFRHLTQLETRSFPRGDPQQSYNRFHNPIAPRFQKQQQYSMRQQQQNTSDLRWGGQHYSANKQRIRGDSEEGKEKDDDSSRRERNTPEPDRFRCVGNRSEYEVNKRPGSFDKKPDSHRNYQHDFNKDNKESDSRIRERDSSELEWEGRRTVSAWEGSRNVDDNKSSIRRDNKKSDAYSKSHSSVFDDRDSEWRERNEIRDRPGRPDSRDSRASRESRTSREESRNISDSVNNDYSWADNEFEKEIHEEKPRRKETYKDDRRENQTHARREGHVPGPITREKMEAYEHKQIMAEVFKAEKKDVINPPVESRGEDESWKKPDNSWTETSEERLQGQQQHQDLKSSQAQNTSQLGSQLTQLQSSQKLHNSQAKLNENSSLTGPSVIDESSDRASKEDSGSVDKKSVGMVSSGPVQMKDKGPIGGRGGGGRSRVGLRQNTYSNANFNAYYSRGSSNWNSSKDSAPRRGPQKSGKAWNASESEGSGDEVSASTESGKEDKKTERKLAPRSPKTGDRKKDKDEHSRESKKTEASKPGDSNNMNRKPVLSGQSQGQPSGGFGQGSGSGQGSGGNYESSGGRKEGGFLPRGEPSRRGRGGFRTPGGRGPVGAHYGPPGSKPAFPVTLTSNKDEDPNESSSEEKKRPIITGRKDQRKSDSDSSRSNKGKCGKVKRDQEEWETTSEGSDSEAKGKPRQNKKPIHRSGGEKRSIFNSGQMNGRPRSEDSKSGEKTRLNKDEEDPSSRLANHSDVFHSNNGFQEVRSKKTGKEGRPPGKDDLKRGRGKEKGKGLPTGGNGKPGGSQGKSYTREWNKPPRMQRQLILQQQQQQQQQHQLQAQQTDSVSDMNKLNQNISMFPMRDVSCPAPAPPPSVNAWDKPITASLRTTSPPSNLHHLASIPTTQEKSVIELNDHGPSGTNSQTSSPSTEKALSKIGRETVEKAFLDGTTPPVQTIVFENTNLKAPSDVALKNKYPLKGQRIEKGRDRKLDEELEDSSHMSLGGFKPGSEIKPGDKSQEPIQMPMSFSKSEDNADMKLDFPFETDLSHLTDDKPNTPRSIHQVLVQSSAADLDQKILSVRKVWDTAGSVIEHQHHDEGVSTSSSSFTPNFPSAADTSLDHSHQITPDDNSFTSDVYTTPNPTSNRQNFFIITGPQIQGSTQGYTNSGGNIIKPDSTNPNSNVCKVKPQPQQAVMSSAIGTHSGQSLSSPPPPFNQQGHYGYQTPYNNMPAIPSPPAVLINSGPGGGTQVPPNHQAAEAQLYHSYTIGGPTMISSGAARTGFSQFPYGPLSQGLGSTSGYSQGNLYLPQPNPQPSDVFQSISQYRMQPSAAAAYGQSQQLNNSPSTVLITSSSNSLMSASVKSSAQPPLGAIGSKAGYQSSAHPSPQVQLSYIQYDAPMLPQSFLQSSQIVQRHGANNVVPTMQATTSYYSSSTGGQTGLFQPGSSLLGGGNQPAALHNATAFGMQGFGAQSATAPAQPTSSNPVGVQSYSSQISHFRAQGPGAGTASTTAYLKASTNPGQHPADPSKSPSTSQDLVNSVFSSGGGGGQIPSPKSRTAANSGGKQTQPPQQPSPTQAPHPKFPSYQTQPNLGMQNSGGRGPPMPQGVRTGASNGNGLSNNGVSRYPTPIQRPVGSYQGIQQGRHRVPPRPQPTHQQHLKISSHYYPHQGNTVKLDVDGKEGDKLAESTNPSSKGEKKEEQANSTEQ